MAESSIESRDSLRCAQLNGLRRLFSEILPSNRFYSKKLRDAGVAANVESIEDFSNRYPVTTKQELVQDQREFQPYGSNLTFPLDRYNRCHQTSGTTGTPLRWLDTPESWRWMLGNWKEVFRAADVESRDRVLFPFSFGPFIGFWLAFEAASEIGCLCLPGGGLSTVSRLHAILDHNVTVFCCTPTYAVRLAEVADAEKIDLRKCGLKTMIVAGEPGGSIPSIRSRLEALWPNVRIFDHHGMTEVGPVTYECPAKPGVLHVIESAFIAEVVDPDSLKPVPLGKTGELILTTLGRTGSPLIRYRTGDLVRALIPRAHDGGSESRCACGRFELALEGGILGRVDNMMIVRGVNIYPSAVEEIIRSMPEIVEYQVQVKTDHSLTEMQVLIEPASECVDVTGVAASLEKRLLKAFSLRIPVADVARGTLPRFELKAKRWIHV